MGLPVRLGADGRLEVVRVGPPDLERLRTTIRRLRAAAGTGAVEIVGATDDGERLELVLCFAGRPPSPAMSGRDAAPILRSVAASLTDLHARGLAHGAIALDHVLVDAEGAVRLCGFGADDGSTTGDVRAFGSLVSDLVDPSDTSEAAGALRAVAVRCSVDDDAARPTMAAVTASLSGASTRTIARRASSTPAATRTRRRWPLVVAAAVIALLAVVTVLPRGARAELPSASPATTTVTSTTTTTRPWPMARELRGDGGSWQFDGRGVALVGAWDCAATTPAIVRPDGSVWIVDMWPADGEAAARYVTTVDGALDAHVESTGGCDDLVVETDDGDVKPTLEP